MTQTGWIIAAIIAIAAILLVALLLRRKPANTLPGESIAPTPAPVVAPPPPQTIAAEETPPAAPATLAVEGIEAITPTPPPAPAVQAELPIALEPVAEPVAEQIVVSTPAPVAPVAPLAEGDNLLKLKGVGPKLATLLRAEGITRFADIAAWTDADLAAIDAKLGSFAGRPTRDNWIDQSRFLAAGDVAGYEAKYGKL